LVERVSLSQISFQSINLFLRHELYLSMTVSKGQN
jgi:hypothetical protein